MNWKREYLYDDIGDDPLTGFWIVYPETTVRR